MSDERDLFGWVEQEEQGRRRKLNENVGNERERERVCQYKLGSSLNNRSSIICDRVEFIRLELHPPFAVRTG